MSPRRSSLHTSTPQSAAGSPLAELAELLRARFPELKSSVDEALDSDRGASVLDMLLGDQRLSVVWSPQRGFGVSSYSEAEFGQGPDEVFETLQDAAERVKQLLLSHTKTSPPAPADLAQLRQWMGYTQVALARRMKVGQGAISKLESRPDARLSTLEAYCKALGCRFQVVVWTPRGAFPLRFLGRVRKSKTRSIP